MVTFSGYSGLPILDDSGGGLWGLAIAQPCLPRPRDPLPTALPLPPSGFDVIWVETAYDWPAGPSGTIWRADPRDIAHRQAIVHFDDQRIDGAALSPNERQVALERTKSL